jgi:murein DD-endopeptidase MepM/ murein hydrolase activator NlpD
VPNAVLPNPPGERDRADSIRAGERDAATGSPPGVAERAAADPQVSQRAAMERAGTPDVPPAVDELGALGRPAAAPVGAALAGHRRAAGAPAAPSMRGGDARSRPSSTWAGNPRSRLPATWSGDPRAQSPLDALYAAPGAVDGARMPPGLARPPAGAHLSPRMTAVFGGLFGLATLTSLIALLIQGVPVRDERAMVAMSSATPLASGGAEASKPGSTLELKKRRTPVPGPWRISELARDSSVIVASDVMERRSFIAALAEKDVPKAQIYRIMKAFEGVRKFDKCGRKDRFTVAMERATRRVRAFEYEVSSSEIYQAKEDASGLLTGGTLDMKISEEETVAAFYVSKDVAGSARAGGLEDGVLDTIDDALSGRVSTESFEEGSTVRLIAVEETALGMFSRYKKLSVVEYRPPDPAQKPIRIYDFTGQEGRGYFDERGRQPYAGGWRAPVPGAPVTSRFNPKRLNPVLKKIMPHNGTDFGAPMGTPVYSAYRGVVEWVGPAGATGNFVAINHPGGITTGYAHLSRFAAGIKVGDKVGTHQLIGYIGSTGRSTGPHLHFSAKKDGKFFDAETLQLDGERVMPGIDRAAFAAAKEALDKRLDAIPLPEPPPEPPRTEPKEATAAATATGSAAIAVPQTPSVGPSDPSQPQAPPPPSGMGDDEEGEPIQGPDLKNTASPGATP